MSGDRPYYHGSGLTVSTNGDFAVTHPPDDSVTALAFSPAAVRQNFLIAGSWDNSVRCWEVKQSGNTVPKSIQSMTMPILDACWSDDGTKVFMASCDKYVKCWDLISNQTIQIAAHEAPVKTCHWVKAPSYTCLMTGSWDKTLKFWDLRSSNPIMVIQLPGRVCSADVDYPIAVIGTTSKGIVVYNLKDKLESLKNIISPFKYQHRCVSIFRDKKKHSPIGFGSGSVDGHLAIQYIEPHRVKENFTLKCHRQIIIGAVNIMDVYAVNDIKFHPVHDTFATVGSDATFAFWNKDNKKKMKSCKALDQPITKCCFNKDGQIFAYSIGYDWSKGSEFYNTSNKPQIFLKPCFEDLKPMTIGM